MEGIASDQSRKNWVETNEYWTEIFAGIYDKSRLNAAPQDVIKILKLIGSKPKTVLDLACGPGRHSLEFARQGLQVTGVDQCEFMISQAKDNELSSDLNPNFIVGDARTFRGRKRYELVVMLGSSFGYSDDPKDDLLILKNVRANLKKGASFVLDLNGKEIISKTFERECTFEADGVKYSQELRITDDWTTVGIKMTVQKPYETRVFTASYRIFSAVELRELLLKAGFKNVRFYGDLDGNDYNFSATRLIAVATK